MEYIVINSAFLILELSSGVSLFSDSLNQMKIGEDMRLFFPELQGSEKTIEKLFTGENKYFKIKEVVRDTKNQYPICCDLFFIGNYQESNVLILIEDVTDRSMYAQKVSNVAGEYRQALQELSIAKNYIDQIINSLRDGLFIINTSGIISKINQATLQIFGYPESELIGKHLTKILAQNENILWQDIIERKDLEIVCQKNTGEEINIDLSCSLLQIELQKEIQFVCLARDITQQKKAQIQMQQLFQRDRLLAMITSQIHKSLDINTILNTTVTVVRQMLNCDRVMIDQFYDDHQEKVIVESLKENVNSLLGKDIISSWEKQFHNSYQDGKIYRIDDINDPSISETLKTLLNQLEIKAELVLPILLSNKELNHSETNCLWGLLAIHQCDYPRQWHYWEINLLKQLTDQLAIAIQQAELYSKVHKMAIMDGLTQIANRRHFNSYLAQEWKRLTREKKPLSLILCDIDHFKAYNDYYGHLGGDFCLQKVAHVFDNISQRPADLAARYGGEEFALILPNTELNGAFYLAERLQKQIRDLQILHHGSIVSEYVTLSMGIATVIPELKYQPQQLIETADQALYKAKMQGRNQIVIASELN
jgi:diguanylate cyclase (GGDEF)-like protein/PAS domain S-box-containing protein